MYVSGTGGALREPVHGMWVAAKGLKVRKFTSGSGNIIKVIYHLKNANLLMLPFF